MFAGRAYKISTSAVEITPIFHPNSPKCLYIICFFFSTSDSEADIKRIPKMVLPKTKNARGPIHIRIACSTYGREWYHMGLFHQKIQKTTFSFKKNIL